MSTKNDKHTIQAELKELEAIAAWFEKDQEFDIEEGLTKVKEGAALVKSLRGKLREVENEFQEIKKELIEADE